MRRNHRPTPLGYALLFVALLLGLYILSPSQRLSSIESTWANDSPTTPLVPGSSGDQEPSTHQDGLDELDLDKVEGNSPGKISVAEPDENEETDHPPLPLLPEVYSSIFPSLTLPSSLLTPELYTLAQRLSNFLSHPILSHDLASKSNYEGCPREVSDKLVNPDQFNGDGPFWREQVDETEIIRRRGDIVRWLSERVDKGEAVLGKDGVTGSGRGIVLTGGNQDTTLRTITAIKHLRRLNVDLPIEVFHFSDELHDEGQRRDIEALGAQLREAKGLNKVEGVWKNWQIVIDKAGNNGLNLAALVIASGMMEDREFWFHMCGGDKDTFRWAFRALGLDFAVSPRWMSALGIKNAYESGRFCGHSVLQYDLVTPEGFTRPPPLFVHSNLLKHLGSGGLGKGSLFTHIRRMSNDYAHNPSLNYAHTWVYTGNGRGMCLDLDWHDNVPESIRSEEWVETIQVGQEEGGVFEGFEDSWFDEGGRIGGW
ncbi:hypothetical protein IAU59_005531 [Kwoniella sp. CBS 9459]